MKRNQIIIRHAKVSKHHQLYYLSIDNSVLSVTYTLQSQFTQFITIYYSSNIWVHRKLLWKLEVNCVISLVVYRLCVCGLWKMGFKLIAEKATRVHALKIHKESNPPQQLLNATIESVAMITALTGSVHAHCAFINENNNKNNKYHQQYIGRVIDRQTKRAKLYTLLYCTAPHRYSLRLLHKWNAHSSLVFVNSK